MWLVSLALSITEEPSVSFEELKAEYGKLFRRRTPVRAKFTRVYTQAHKSTQQKDPDVSKLKWYVEELNEVFSKMNQLDAKMEEIIMEISSDEEVNKFYREKDERHESDSLRLYELKEFIKSLAKPKQDSTVEQGLSVLAQNIVQMVKVQEETIKSLQSKPAVGVKLPELSLPKFNGDPLKWTEFWDLYKATIHENVRISNVQKLAYLRNQLEGTALETVEGYNK